MPVFPLGSHVDDSGVRFAVASTSADSVEVCLVDGPDHALTERRVELTERTFGVWHGHVPGVVAGQRYGYRVQGPYRPWQGLRANPAKILVDPYARRITGHVTDLGAARGWVDDPMTGALNERDSLGHVPLSVVSGPDGSPTHPRPDVPWSETVITELHVRGYTKSHPDVPPEHRGTYLGLAHPAVIAHLTRIGVTAVELLPVTSIADEPPLLERGLPNYWGYATLGFLAPHAGYASVPGAEVEEFATMVGALHAAGIEVILDIVPNHTAEGGVGGTTLSYRGLDAPAYYSLGGNGHDADITGTGNTLDAGSPTVIRLVCDAMRHWVTTFGVDGFRIDLASVLGRPRSGAFDPHAPLLTAIAVDPILSRVKLIAEPWDATGEGYRVGGFGVAWSEWNGRFRDAVRDFWRGHGGIGEVASRLTGSSDLYAANGRRPWASVNFVTAHDGFTLRDLVSYHHKHNEENGEGNRDGTDDNRSQNFGVEGPTTSPVIAERRLSAARALLATMLLSTGTPMLLGGDELWRTQGGNNNAYCLDGPTSWVGWGVGADAESLTAFVARVTTIRRSSPALHRDSFYRDGEVLWWHPSGRRLRGHDWHDGGLHSLGLLRGEWLLLLHAGWDALAVTLPDGGPYVPELDSTRSDGVPAGLRPVPGGATITQPPRSLLLLRTP
ncbi:glycogen debranching protein GlgX [Pseudonocardia abyssalis]|uniref:Glycogen debranching protein GlgX n=1 Tax=Pseudonocardia abyssalis TaxID=2792008 RepID=A0ABS6UU83_9PSEU|nr:glycogen debranching protein GlgX [Pseudonocardia abyssalis]MBW0114720.1 glycogen debranching protein GlgX [Pseudonocardia abyssalis]MBW0135818.1 glycogen debranching protein GlgX [Pseudonocardia abyssalis]